VDKKLTELANRALSRRNFLAGSGAVAAATLVGCGSSSSTSPASPTKPPDTDPSDTDVLNFALNLEYLEAQFYLYAATGTGLSADDIGNSPGNLTVPSGALVPGLNDAQKAYLYEIAQNELDHVRFLRSALGSDAVSMPSIDLTAFAPLAVAAGIGSGFNPFVSYEAFLVGAFVFEDVGVTAYHGGALLLSNTPTGKAYLAAAVEIHAVEAYHAAEIRTLLIADSVMNATTANGVVSPNNTYINYANKVSALRGQLGGGMETPITPLPPYNVVFDPTQYTPASSIVACDSNSIGYKRSTDQVLHIVYGTAGGAGITGGGFFPDGMNGNISVTGS
jgi:hypothetical protein